jgi:hypothetical protein
MGNLYLTEKQGAGFSAQDEEAAVILAGWAAIAIDHAQGKRGPSCESPGFQGWVIGLQRCDRRPWWTAIADANVLGVRRRRRLGLDV